MSTRTTNRIAESISHGRSFIVENGLQGSPFRATGPISLKGISDNLARHVRYIVFSYNMPIAYRLSNGTWILPMFDKESTPRHNQDILREALTINRS